MDARTRRTNIAFFAGFLAVGLLVAFLPLLEIATFALLCWIPGFRKRLRRSPRQALAAGLVCPATFLIFGPIATATVDYMRGTAVLKTFGLGPYRGGPQWFDPETRTWWQSSGCLALSTEFVAYPIHNATVRFLVRQFGTMEACYDGPLPLFDEIEAGLEHGGFDVTPEDAADGVVRCGNQDIRLTRSAADFVHAQPARAVLVGDRCLVLVKHVRRETTSWDRVELAYVDAATGDFVWKRVGFDEDDVRREDEKIRKALD